MRLRLNWARRGYRFVTLHSHLLLCWWDLLNLAMRHGERSCNFANTDLIIGRLLEHAQSNIVHEFDPLILISRVPSSRHPT